MVPNRGVVFLTAGLLGVLQRERREAGGLEVVRLEDGSAMVSEYGLTERIVQAANSRWRCPIAFPRGSLGQRG